MAKKKKKKKASGETWLEVAFHDGDTLTEWIARFDGDLEADLLSADPTAFVKLQDVRWLDPFEPRIRRLEAEPIGTGSTVYLARQAIVRVIPLRDEASFWEEGDLPDEVAEELESLFTTLEEEIELIEEED